MAVGERAGAAALEAFADEVGGAEAGPVVAVGGRTQWTVGGLPAPEAREVAAPRGVVSYEPAEMTVRVRAGTTVAELDAAVAEYGQMVVLDGPEPERATVGGVLAVGHSGIRRLRYGPVRDTVLEARFVDAQGRLVKAGGPVVKNVTGFDLCRLMVGSLGTLGFLAEVVLRCQPRPPCALWLHREEVNAPAEVHRRLFRPSSVLWDGTSAWVLLEGHQRDVEAEAARLGPDWREAPHGPVWDAQARASVRPSEVGELCLSLSQPFVAEIGIGVVHLSAADAAASSAPAPAPPVRRLHDTIKRRFDPTGRLNPGRSVLT